MWGAAHGTQVPGKKRQTGMRASCGTPGEDSQAQAASGMMGLRCFIIMGEQRIGFSLRSSTKEKTWKGQVWWQSRGHVSHLGKVRGAVYLAGKGRGRVGVWREETLSLYHQIDGIRNGMIHQDH